MNTRDVAWSRFWLPRTGIVDLSDGGFLVDPTKPVFRSRTPPPVPLAELTQFRALGLIGEPGMGKSSALRADFGRLAAATEDDTTISVHFDLRDFSSEAFLYKQIFESPEITAWKLGTTHLVLHLDSLDEALLRIDSIANLITSELRRLPVDRLSIRIACRTAVWPEHTLEPALREIWADGAVGVFELAPLRRTDVTAAAKARALNPEAFIEQLYEANVVPFAIKPLTLNLLLGLFHSDGRLPRSIVDIYRLGCRKLCEEQNPSRRDTRRLGQLNPDQRLRLASRIAAVTTFANRYAIWTGAETEPFPQADVPLSMLSAGSEEGDFKTFSCDESNLREVLDTGLFSARGVARMGWAHQSYSEFLAAHYLAAKGTQPVNVLTLLVHPSGGLVPQLATVAAWAASLNAEIRKELISQEPLADIPQMAGPPGRLRGSLLAVRRPLQRRKRRDGARGQRHRPVIAVRPEILLGRATNERSCPADSQRRQ